MCYLWLYQTQFSRHCICCTQVLKIVCDPCYTPSWSGLKQPSVLIYMYIPCEQLKPKSHLPKLMDLWRIGECCCEPCAEKKKINPLQAWATCYSFWFKKTKYCFRVLLHVSWSFKIKGNHNQDCIALVSVRVGGWAVYSLMPQRLIKKQLRSRPCLQLPRIQSNTGTRPHQI